MAKAKLTISRYSGGTDEDEKRPIHIRVEDDSSGIEFVDVALSLEDFAAAITGHGHIPCSATTRGLDLIGNVRQAKSEVVMVPKNVCRDAEAIRAAVAEHEVDGWIGRDDDARNSHNRVARDDCDGMMAYRVVFIRYVAKTEADDAEA